MSMHIIIDTQVGSYWWIFCTDIATHVHYSSNHPPITHTLDVTIFIEKIPMSFFSIIITVYHLIIYYTTTSYSM